MSYTQRKAVITLIEKQGKDRTLMENWRPISLINVDAKIISKVIAARVKDVLPSIIHHNQTGYVKDRYIGETVRSIDVDWVSEKNEEKPLGINWPNEPIKALGVSFTYDQTLLQFTKKTSGRNSII